MTDERRKLPRRKAVIPVKIVDGDGSQHIHTLDICSSGARIGGLRSHLQVGGTIVLHRGIRNAKFRIVWIRQISPSEVHAGVEALEYENGLFGSVIAPQGSKQRVSMTV
jgi:hypothetical protein